MRAVKAQVAIVGAGPAGLTLARSLGGRGVSDVLIIDREVEPGGVPRYSDHQGYGLRDLHQPLTGPNYARHLALRAVRSGARILTEATVTDINPMDHTLEVTSPSGRFSVTATAIVLATGCRERPRSARLVPGFRPAGVYTTGWLQRLVHLQHGSPGKRAVIVGAEHVSYSAVLTLRDARCAVVAMVTERPRHDSFLAFNALARARWRFPVLTSTTVLSVLGEHQVTGIEVAGSAGDTRALECDCVIFTGDWVAENELARRAGAILDPGTGGPSVDGRMRTTVPGVFAIGNLTHPAATADICALEGRHAAAGIGEYLGSDQMWPKEPLPLITDGPIAWASPNLVFPDALAMARGKMLVQFTTRLRAPRLEVLQGDKRLWAGFLPWAVPTRPMPISCSWLTRVLPSGPPPVLRVLP